MLSKINRQECTEEQTFAYEFQHAMQEVICPFVKGIMNESSAQSYETAAFKAYNTLMSIAIGIDHEDDIPAVYKKNLDRCKRALKTIENDSTAYIAEFSKALKRDASVERQETLDEMRTKMGAKFRDVVYDFLTNAYTIMVDEKRQPAMVDEKRQPATEATGNKPKISVGLQRRLKRVLNAEKAGSWTSDTKRKADSETRDARWTVFLSILISPFDDKTTLIDILRDANFSATAYKANTHQDGEVSKVADFIIDLSELVFKRETITFGEFYNTVTKLHESIRSILTKSQLNDICKRHFTNLVNHIDTVGNYMYMYENSVQTNKSAAKNGKGVRKHIRGAVNDATKLLETGSCVGTQVVYTVPKLAPTVSSMEGAKRVSEQIRDGYYGLW